MAAAIHTASDTQGLHMALLSLFEESFHRGLLKDTMPMSSPETIDRMVAAGNQRDLSPGYYTRATYLLDLGATMELGIAYAASDLKRDDVVGLLTLRRARAEFEREHPACGNCGTRQENRFSPKCRGCRLDFARGDS